MQAGTFHLRASECPAERCVAPGYANHCGDERTVSSTRSDGKTD